MSDGTADEDINDGQGDRDRELGQGSAWPLIAIAVPGLAAWVALVDRLPAAALGVS